ncbi:Asp23/Gls24 family envelope stress response protein [Eggerthellaceae bacterium zg-893]|nr:Asp23/Gls24 family envelope stress response protein [Eggerthellaceae bacterium zg-893]
MTEELKTTEPDVTAIEPANVDAEVNAPEPLTPVYKLTIADNVVEKIAARAAARIDGIVAMKGNLFSTIQEGFGANTLTKGVSADLLDDNTARVELDVILEYGKSAVDVFDQVKDVVVGDLQSMTGLLVSELDVNVVDVMSREEYGHKKGEDKKAKDVTPAMPEAAEADEPSAEPQKTSATVVSTGL